MMRHPVAAVVATLLLLFGPTTVDRAAATPADQPTRPDRVACATEDAATACVWDARHRGDQTGRSFVVRPNGDVVPVTHTRAHALLTGGAS